MEDWFELSVLFIRGDFFLVRACVFDAIKLFSLLSPYYIPVFHEVIMLTHVSHFVLNLSSEYAARLVDGESLVDAIEILVIKEIE